MPSPEFPTETTGQRLVVCTGTVASGTGGTVMNATSATVAAGMPGTNDDFTTMYIHEDAAILENITDGSSAVITAITDLNTLTCSGGLAGGTLDVFTAGDSYRVLSAPNVSTDDYNNMRKVNATWETAALSGTTITLLGDSGVKVTYSGAQNLATINGTSDGDKGDLIVDATGAGAALTIQHGVGNIRVAGGADVVMDDDELVCRWYHIGSIIKICPQG